MIVHDSTVDDSSLSPNPQSRSPLYSPMIIKAKRLKKKDFILWGHMYFVSTRHDVWQTTNQKEEDPLDMTQYPLRLLMKSPRFDLLLFTEQVKVVCKALGRKPLIIDVCTLALRNSAWNYMNNTILRKKEICELRRGEYKICNLWQFNLVQCKTSKVTQT